MSAPATSWITGVVLSLYFSNCLHKERAAFLLCDELIEVTCREKVKQSGANPRQLDFPA